MIFRRILSLDGPNVWSRSPILELRVDLTEQQGVTRRQMETMRDRLSACLPELAGQVAMRSTGTPTNGKRTTHSTAECRLLDLADALSLVCLELQKRVSAPVSWSRTCELVGSNVYAVAIPFEENEVARAALEAARDLCLAGLADANLEIQPILELLSQVADRVCLGPSTRAIVRAAQARCIPVRRLNLGSFVQLGHGAAQRRVRTAETDRTGAVAEEIAHDKELTKELLQAVGVPVPEGRAVTSPADAWAAAEEIGVPVVVKPRDGNHGRGVFTALMTQEQVESAYAHASEEGDGVLVERFALGAEHRLLVVDGKFVAGTRGDPAAVVGDGQHSILELIESQLNSDPRRGHTDDCPLAPVSIDAVARLLLAQRGYTESSVPPAGDRVLIQYNGNLAIDVTDDVHPDVIARLIDAAQVVGLDVAGIDVVAQDIRRPLEEQGGVVVEVNAGPGLHMHLYPSVGKPRPVGEAIVASLYPDDPAGRVPLLVALEGHEDCHVAYAAAEVLNAGSAAAGLSCQRGIYVGMRRLTSPPPRERQAADMLLANNRVESAVVGVTATGILETGLAVDVCDVAIVADQPMNTAASDTDLFDHEWTAAARALVESVARHGAAVVHANDPRLQRLSEGVGEALVLLAEDEKNAMLVEHRAAGRRAVLVRHGQVIAVSGASEVFLASLARLPIDRLAEAGVSVRVLLAAAAAGWVLGRSPRLIRAGLESFAHECLLRHGFDSLSSPAESEVPIGEKDPKAA